MIMRSILYVFIISAITLVSCTGNENRSDAYGNFEATEIIISAQAMGEIEQLDFEEGDVLQKDAVVGIIDTTDLVLSRALYISKNKP